MSDTGATAYHSNISVFATKDSGERRDFATGSRRDSDAGKPYIRRIPPLVRERLGGLYRRGADKYADANDPIENWKKGQPLHEFYESLHRHLTKSEMGMEDEDHDAAVLWGMCSIMMTKHYIRTDQLPDSLAAAFNAVVREYGGVEVKNPPTYTTGAPRVAAHIVYEEAA